MELYQAALRKVRETLDDVIVYVPISGKLSVDDVAAGGAVAYANIGKASNKEVINAKITNATITTQNAGVIDVESLDNAKMTTVGTGAGASGGKFAFQGAAAVSNVNKDNIAEISNSNITGGTPDIKIISTSGGNGNDGLNFGDDKINVNNKINTATGVIDVDFTDETWFNGEFAIGVNKFNQSTQANFKNTTRPKIVSNAGNVNIYSNSEADILGVLAGCSGGKSKVSASGSTAYNFINNSAESLVENANVNASKNFGVVSQSDDKIANYAGAVNINVGGYAPIGVSVAYNEITGNTNANVKDSELEVTGSNSDLIAISNPKDNLLDGYVTKNNWTSGGLFKGRKSENKSGVVVNSSATHSISSDLATIGIRASADKSSVGVSGTVNINKISGATNAKVEGSNVSGNTDSFVNASDYTNNGSFIGNAAVSGTAAIVFAAASGDNVVRNQMDGTTTAKIENATVNHSGAVNVDAYHKDNAFATNIAGSAAVDTSIVGAVGVNNNYVTNTVHAGIKKNSTLNVGAVDVNAKNTSEIKADGGVASVAVNIS